MPTDGTNEPIHTVAQVIERVNRVLDDEFLPMWVTGEISNLYDTYHWYFNLIEGNASLSCAVFKSVNERIRFEVKNGVKVNVRGKFAIYPEQGKFQIMVDRMELAGEGALRAEFERLKRDLEQEGLFRTEHKKPIPRFPKRIALLTAQSGAAVRDVVQNFARRYPLTEIVHIPTLVQGRNAPDEIMAAIQQAMRQDVNADVVLLTRGGGSFEDLNAFNDEGVARAIFACPIPVVSAVGHEKDVSISDFVADRRAATPSTAVELMAPDIDELRISVSGLRQRLQTNTDNALDERMQHLRTLFAQLRDPTQLIDNRVENVIGLHERLTRFIDSSFTTCATYVDSLEHRLQQSSPQNQLDALETRFSDLNHRLELSNPLERLAEYEKRHSDSLQRLEEITVNSLEQEQANLRLTLSQFERIDLVEQIDRHISDVNELQETLTRTTNTLIERCDTTLRRNEATLHAVSPFATLERGYAVVAKPDGSRWGEVISDIDAVIPDEPITAHIHGGSINAIVQSTEARDDADEESTTDA